MSYRHPDPRRPEMQAKWLAEEALRHAQASNALNRAELIAQACKQIDAATLALRQSVRQPSKKK